MLTCGAKSTRTIGGIQASFYTLDPNRRNCADIKKCSQSKCFGCINEPLIDIALDHVVPDELHLL